MKLFALCIVLVTFATTILGQELYCYVCDDCDNPTNEDVEYCGPPTAPTTTPTTTSGSTESSTTTTTPTTTPASTESSTIETTSESTASSPTETTTTPTTTPEPIASSPTETTPTTTPEPIASSTTETTPTTTPEPIASSTTETTPTTTPEAAAPVPGLDRMQNSNAAALLLRNYRAISRSRRAADDSYACYRIAIKNEDGTWHVKRGCAAIEVSQTGCDAIEEQAGEDKDNLKDCFVCVNDRCNGSATVQISIVALLTALVLKYLF